MEQAGVEYVATGLAGAWILAPLATFRTVSLYVKEEPPGRLLESLGFREETRGANVWIVVPRDEAFMSGSVVRDGVVAAHAIQVYLDLKAHPERSSEAADRLRQEILGW